jgi:hypothetical protein
MAIFDWASSEIPIVFRTALNNDWGLRPAFAFDHLREAIFSGYARPLTLMLDQATSVPGHNHSFGLSGNFYHKELFRRHRAVGKYRRSS